MDPVVDTYHPSSPRGSRELGIAEPPRLRRRVRLPVIFFLLTCASTFWAGASLEPGAYLMEAINTGSLLPMRRAILANYEDGLLYMMAVIGILFAHEMGHFVMTLIHRVPSSLPFFLPLPIAFTGTMGAVIRMHGGTANRRQIFDIGIGGPIAGLVIAVPVLLLGLQDLELRTSNGLGMVKLQLPLGMIALLQWVGPKALHHYEAFALGHLQGNPLVLAGWFGFIVTGLNMLPVSQLDGGHVLYCLFGPRSRWISRGLVVAAVLYMILRWDLTWLLMVLIILFLGVDHPPTANDRVRLGPVRYCLGTISLFIPLLCFPAIPIKYVS